MCSTKRARIRMCKEIRASQKHASEASPNPFAAFCGTTKDVRFQEKQTLQSGIFYTETVTNAGAMPSLVTPAVDAPPLRESKFAHGRCKVARHASRWTCRGCRSISAAGERKTHHVLRVQTEHAVGIVGSGLNGDDAPCRGPISPAPNVRACPTSLSGTRTRFHR